MTKPLGFLALSFALAACAAESPAVDDPDLEPTAEDTPRVPDEDDGGASGIDVDDGPDLALGDAGREASPDAGPRPAKYHLPWACNHKERCTAGNYQFHHQPPYGQYAFDFAAPKGTPVLATRGGKITFVDASVKPGDACYDGCIGKTLSTCCPRCIDHVNQVKVQHSDGTVAQYAHLDSVSVKVGQVVAQGAEVGRIGTTGCSTGYHLHFEVAKGNATSRYSGATVSISFGEAGKPVGGTTLTSKNACP